MGQNVANGNLFYTPAFNIQLSTIEQKFLRHKNFKKYSVPRGLEAASINTDIVNVFRTEVNTVSEAEYFVLNYIADKKIIDLTNTPTDTIINEILLKIRFECNLIARKTFRGRANRILMHPDFYYRTIHQVNKVSPDQFWHIGRDYDEYPNILCSSPWELMPVAYFNSRIFCSNTIKENEVFVIYENSKDLKVKSVFDSGAVFVVGDRSEICYTSGQNNEYIESSNYMTKLIFKGLYDE